MPWQFPKEELLPLFQELSRSINSREDTRLDPAFAARLKASNAVSRHGTDGRVLQYHVWDRYQPGVFEKKYFKYEVQHDPVQRYTGTKATNFCVQFWVSKIRIYHERDAVVNRFWKGLQKVSVRGFRLEQNEQAIFMMHKFRAESICTLEEQINTTLFPLINAVHPVFYRVLDAFNVPLSSEERRSVIEGRIKINPADRLNPNFGIAPEYNHNVPSLLRRQTFERDGYVCQHCGASGTSADLHADHVLPFSHGGLTLLTNLQTLCGPCNLKKGGRLELPSHQA